MKAPAKRARRLVRAGPRAIVKDCPLCAARFTVTDLVRGAQLEPIGMASLDGGPEQTAYYFTHTRPGCCTTFTVPASVFAGLLANPPPPQLLFGTDSCPGHCKRLGDLEVCTNPCHNSPYRTFLIDVLARRGKGPKGPSKSA